MSSLSDFLATDYDRQAIGSIAEFIGMADFYTIGYSAWLRTNTYVASSNLTAAGKLHFQQGPTSSSSIAANGDASVDNANCWFANLPIPRIASSSISVLPIAALVTGGVIYAGVITSAGIQAIATGQTSYITAAGCSANYASDGTNLWCGVFTGTNTWTNYKSTNGTTWAAQAQSGLPTFAVATTARTWPSGTGIVKDLAGENLTIGGEQIFYTYCGAKHLLWASDGTNMMGSLSTDGLVWGGNNTVAMVGATPIPKAGGFHQFYRNPGTLNDYWFTEGSGVQAYRYSTDGGASWNACTGHPTSVSTNHRFKRNAATPAKLAWVEVTTTNSWFSSNSGQTWTARTLPAAVTAAGGFAYVGAVALIVVASNLYRSADDGATWALVSLPIGTLGAASNVAGDGNRFYLRCGANAQILTSTDGLTWTLRAMSMACPLFIGIVSYSSSQVALISGTDTVAFTNDGGVTWIVAALDTTSRANIKVGDAYTTPDGGGTGFGAPGVGGSDTSYQVGLAGSDFTAGGYWYRTGNATVTPLRANAICYTRVA